MKLILLSEFIPNEVTLFLKDAFPYGLHDKLVEIIPNAQDEVMNSNTLRVMEYFELQHASPSVLDLNNTTTTIAINRIMSSSIVYFCGGYLSKLIKAVDEHDLRSVFEEFLKENRILMGNSSGSMLMSKTTFLAEKFIGEVDPEVKDLEGLGMVDFEIYPHYEDSLKDRILEILPNGVKAYAMKDWDAIIVDGKDIRFIGDVVKLK